MRKDDNFGMVDEGQIMHKGFYHSIKDNSMILSMLFLSNLIMVMGQEVGGGLSDPIFLGLNILIRSN